MVQKDLEVLTLLFITMEIMEYMHLTQLMVYLIMFMPLDTQIVVFISDNVIHAILLFLIM